MRAQAEFGEEAFAAQRARAEADRRAAKEAAAAGAADANAIPLGQRVRPAWMTRVDIANEQIAQCNCSEANLRQTTWCGAT